MLDKFVDDHDRDWDTELDAFLFGYHATPHPHYGFSPFYIMYGRNCNGTSMVLLCVVEFLVC